MTRTQVGIIGAGPAGLFLGQLLHACGVESVILESRSREYIEHRIRAGVLEQGTVDALAAAGVGAGVQARGLVHDGVLLRFDGRTHRIDFRKLTGKAVTIYAQHDLVRDLVAARLDAGPPLLFDAQATAVSGLDSREPVIHYQRGGVAHELTCDVIAGCDGSHGVARAAMPAERVRTIERDYPFAWLGILAEAPPSEHELVYANHERGFALHSMRSPSISRLYLQCAPDEDLAAWPDERIWSELALRLADRSSGGIATGRILDRSVTPMRSSAAEPMRYGRLFLAGDAAHIMPPTGAKGLNLAIADARLLAEALEGWFVRGDPAGMDAYSETCLRRVWKVQRFAWWMTSLFHRFAGDEFDRRMQLAELDYVTSSEAAATTLAENYVGLPLR